MPPWNNNCSANCREIVLIDTPVYLHPDLGSAVLSGGVTESDARANLTATEPFLETDHGTHLAGIIASQDNNFGLVGIHPTARIHSWNWENFKGHHDELSDEITQREGEANGLTIYLIATKWDLKPYHSREHRFTDDILARRISDEKIFLIAAAGQPRAPDDTAVDLTVTTPYGR